MPKDFSGQNLRGRSFKGQDLTGANFSKADIRGTNFTNAILKSANFSHAKAGLQRRWIIVLVIVSLLLSALSGFISGIAGVFVEALCSSISQDSIIPGGVILIVLAVFLLIISIRYGLGIVSGTVAGVVLSTVSATVSTGVAKVTMPLVATITVAGVGIGVGVGAAAVSGVVAVAGVRVGAVAVAVSGILAAAWAAIGAWGMGVVQKAAARLVGSTVGAATGAISMLGAMAAAAVVVLLGGYIGWCALTGDDKYPFVRTLAIAFAATGGSSFRKANLTDANFSQATLKSTDFRGAILIRTRWSNTKKLDRARVGNSILAKASIRDLLVSGDGYKKSYVGANLKGANLTRANLEKANLKEADISQATLQEANLKEANLTKTQAVGTDFTNAYLTSACLEAWNIDSTTKLDRVDCQYVYLLEHEQPGSSQRGERRPSSGDFASGEFTKLFEEVLNTVDLIFRDGVDWKAFVTAFKKVQVENEGTELAIQSIENKGDGVVVVRVRALQ